jgi:hypothetical protein
VSGHVLLIPPTGPLTLLHSKNDIDVWQHLHDEGEAIVFSLDTIPGASVAWHNVDGGEPNERARSVLASLVGVHVVMTGTVAFAGLDPEVTSEVITEFG